MVGHAAGCTVASTIELPLPLDPLPKTCAALAQADIPFLLRRARPLDRPGCGILRSQIPRLSVEDVDVILCGRLTRIGAKHNCMELVALIGALDWHHHKKPWSLEHCNV
jgi:hypothetical protein